ncbi:MAG: DUF3570 domain-containing protein [Fibrobacteria bacterium]
MLNGVSRLLWAACLGLSGTAVFASESGSSLEVKHEYFWDRNGVWNHTPAFALKLALSRKWSLGWEQEFDIVTGASRRLGADLVGKSGDGSVDAVSGASKIETRYSENPSLTYAHKGVTAGVSYYTSRESDYFSQSPAVTLSWDLNDRNTTVGVNYAEFFDSFEPEGFFTGMGGKKRIHSLGGTLVQSITSLTLVGVTGSWITSDGYLGHPYNPPMDATGTMLTEIVPDKKQAGALAGQIVQGFHLGERLGSINLDARRYQDDWGLKSMTYDLKLSQYLSEGTYVRLRLRYYNQTGAAFAKPAYTGQEAYRTGDIRFYPFISWLGGLKISSDFPESWGESIVLPDRWDVKYDQTFRNTHGDPDGNQPGVPRRISYQLYEPAEMYQQGVFMLGLLFNL